MTCTDGGEDNSPVHDTYHEDVDQVTSGSDLLVFGPGPPYRGGVVIETRKNFWACLLSISGYPASQWTSTHAHTWVGSGHETRA